MTVESRALRRAIARGCHDALEQIRKDFLRLLFEAARTQSRYDVFSRWLQWAMATRMLDIIGENSSEAGPFLADREDAFRRAHQGDRERFETMAALLGAWFDEMAEIGDPAAASANGLDLLGHVTMMSELGNASTGQFFTPSSVARLMAQMTLTGIGDAVAATGYACIHEPTCGSGVLLLDAAQHLAERGLIGDVVAAGIDLDIDCARMAWLQLSHTALPAIIIHGDGLTHPVTVHRKWGTPALPGFLAKYGVQAMADLANRPDVVLANPPFGAAVGKAKKHSTT